MPFPQQKGKMKASSNVIACKQVWTLRAQKKFAHRDEFFLAKPPNKEISREQSNLRLKSHAIRSINSTMHTKQQFLFNYNKGRLLQDVYPPTKIPACDSGRNLCLFRFQVKLAHSLVRPVIFDLDCALFRPVNAKTRVSNRYPPAVWFCFFGLV